MSETKIKKFDRNEQFFDRLNGICFYTCCYCGKRECGKYYINIELCRKCDSNYQDEIKKKRDKYYDDRLIDDIQRSRLKISVDEFEEELTKVSKEINEINKKYKLSNF